MEAADERLGIVLRFGDRAARDAALRLLVVEWEAGRLPGSLPPVAICAPALNDLLTDRQREVHRLVSMGSSHREAAAALGVTVSTVRSNVRAINTVRRVLAIVVKMGG